MPRGGAISRGALISLPGPRVSRKGFVQPGINVRSAKILTCLSRTLERWTFALNYLFSITVRITAKDNVTSGLPFRSKLRGDRSKRLVVSRVVGYAIFMH